MDNRITKIDSLLGTYKNSMLCECNMYRYIQKTEVYMFKIYVSNKLLFRLFSFAWMAIFCECGIFYFPWHRHRIKGTNSL